jgi:hypothetical protein
MFGFCSLSLSLSVQGSVLCVKCQYMCKIHIQGVPGGKVNILGGHSIVILSKKLYKNVCPILNGFRDKAI